MKCSEVMKRSVECCRRDESVELAAEKMKRRNLGFLPVCDDHGSIVGTLTDRDLALRVLGEHRDAQRTRVRDVMTAEVVYCSPDDDLSVAEQMMAQYKKSRIMCADEGLQPLGVISLSDIAQIEHGGRAVEILEAVASREGSA